MEHFDSCVIPSPLGNMEIVAQNSAIVSISFCNSSVLQEPSTPLLQQAQQQLQEYFSHCRTCFSLPLAPKGTPFQQKVWQALQTIPYGQVCSYQQIAVQIGSPKACRAVGMANHHNPIAIVIPCHRVIGKNGSLTGYAAGISRKEQLLKLEQQYTKTD